LRQLLLLNGLCLQEQYGARSDAAFTGELLCCCGAVRLSALLAREAMVGPHKLSLEQNHGREGVSGSGRERE
jgi:hypothetical protein